MTVQEYMRRFRFALRDLPWKVRRELAAELRDHIAELEPGVDLYLRLGSPESYAADLRAAAGLEQRHGVVAFIRARRPRNLVAVVLAVTLVGLAIGTLVWVNSYQPLAFGNGWFDPPGSQPNAGRNGQHVAFRQGGHFGVGISIVNYGRFTVRILGVTGGYDHSFAELPLAQRRLTVSGPHENRGQFVGPFTTFHSFDLRPGQVMFLRLSGTYDAPCHRTTRFTQDFWAFGGFEIRYRFLWHTGTAQLDVPDEPLQINGPKNESCD